MLNLNIWGYLLSYPLLKAITVTEENDQSFYSVQTTKCVHYIHFLSFIKYFQNSMNFRNFTYFLRNIFYKIKIRLLWEGKCQKIYSLI